MLPRTLPRTLPHRSLPPPQATRRFTLTHPRQSPPPPPTPAAAPAEASTADEKVKLRRIVLTSAAAALTIVGAMTGAQLKTESDNTPQGRSDDKKAARRELSHDAQIAMLEERRAALLGLKIPLELKLARLRENMKKSGGEREGRT